VIIVLLDESALFVFDSIDDAVGYIEPVDAERELRAAYDDSAVPYAVEWVTRNRGGFTGFLFGPPDEYRLVPAGPPDRPALIRLLEAYPITNPPEAGAQCQALLARLRVV